MSSTLTNVYMYFYSKPQYFVTFYIQLFNPPVICLKMLPRRTSLSLGSSYNVEVKYLQHQKETVAVNRKDQEQAASSCCLILIPPF